MSDELEEIKVIYEGKPLSQCPMCEERLYKNNVYHECADAGMPRYDLYLCIECNKLKSATDHNPSNLVDYLIACDCDEEFDDE